MDLTPTELYTVKKGTRSLTEYVITSINKHRYEVKDGNKVIYEGESYQDAKSLYEQAHQEETQPVVSEPAENSSEAHQEQEEAQPEISKTAKTPTLTYRRQEIHFRDNGLVNLTRAWKTAGAPEDKHPKQWLELASTPQLIKAVGKDFNVEESDLLVTERGRYGGTFAHWQIFLAYAKYLSPEFYMWASQVIKERF